jgi:hypothetical protein
MPRPKGTPKAGGRKKGSKNQLHRGRKAQERLALAEALLAERLTAAQVAELSPIDTLRLIMRTQTPRHRTVLNSSGSLARRPNSSFPGRYVVTTRKTCTNEINGLSGAQIADPLL